MLKSIRTLMLVLIVFFGFSELAKAENEATSATSLEQVVPRRWVNLRTQPALLLLNLLPVIGPSGSLDSEVLITDKIGIGPAFGIHGYRLDFANTDDLADKSKDVQKIKDKAKEKLGFDPFPGSIQRTEFGLVSTAFLSGSNQVGGFGFRASGFWVHETIGKATQNGTRYTGEFVYELLAETGFTFDVSAGLSYRSPSIVSYIGPTLMPSLGLGVGWAI